MEEKTKKPISLLFSDFHLSLENVEEVEGLFEQSKEIVLEKNIPYIFILGDAFESRNAQPLKVLNTFGKLISKLSEIESLKEIIILPGNHDKVNYKSEESYLDEFKFHPKIRIVDSYWCFDIEDKIRCHFIPYFDEKTIYPDYLNKVKYGKGFSPQINSDILFTHIAVNGVKNNDGNLVQNNLKISLFKEFQSIFVGHYHNKSFVGKNVCYIGSLLSHSFGENNDKGFTILYENGTTDFIKGKFREFHTFEVDLDGVTLNELEEFYLKLDSLPSQDYKRVIFYGEESKFNSLDKRPLTSKGVYIDFRGENREGVIVEEEIIKFDKSSLVNEFKNFCEENKLDFNQGIEFLNKQLKL